MERNRKIQGKLDPEKSNIDEHSAHSIPPLSAKHQQIISQHLPIGIVETSFEGKYIDVNEEFCSMVGYEREELLQRGIRDLTHEDDYHVDIKLHGQLAADEIPHYTIE